jgi:hypothetical protein
VGSKLIVLDESKQRRHRILSVGGVVAELSDLPDLEEIWREAREEAGVEAGTAIKYSMNWPGGPGQRAKLIDTVGQLPLKAVIALLEDFRPLGMKLGKRPGRTPTSSVELSSGVCSAWPGTCTSMLPRKDRIS